MARVAQTTRAELRVGGQVITAGPIEHHLRQAGIAEPRFQLRVSSGPELDSLDLDVEITQDLFQDEMRRLEELRVRVKTLFYEHYRLPVEVHLVEPGSIARRPDGGRRLVDLRR